MFLVKASFCLGHSSGSSSQGSGSGGSDEEEGEKKRSGEEGKEEQSTGSLCGAGGEGEAGSLAADGGNKAPKPKTPQQRMKNQYVIKTYLSILRLRFGFNGKFGY